MLDVGTNENKTAGTSASHLSKVNFLCLADEVALLEIANKDGNR